MTRTVGTITLSLKVKPLKGPRLVLAIGLMLVAEGLTVLAEKFTHAAGFVATAGLVKVEHESERS